MYNSWIIIRYNELTHLFTIYLHNAEMFFLPISTEQIGLNVPDWIFINFYFETYSKQYVCFDYSRYLWQFYHFLIIYFIFPLFPNLKRLLRFFFSLLKSISIKIVIAKSSRIIIIIIIIIKEMKLDQPYNLMLSWYLAFWMLTIS